MGNIRRRVCGQTSRLPPRRRETDTASSAAKTLGQKLFPGCAIQQGATQWKSPVGRWVLLFWGLTEEWWGASCQMMSGSQQNWGLGQFYCYAALIYVAENEVWTAYQSGSAGISAGGLGSNPSGAFLCGLGWFFFCQGCFCFFRGDGSASVIQMWSNCCIDLLILAPTRPERSVTVIVVATLLECHLNTANTATFPRIKKQQVLIYIVHPGQLLGCSSLKGV